MQRLRGKSHGLLYGEYLLYQDWSSSILNYILEQLGEDLKKWLVVQQREAWL